MSSPLQPAGTLPRWIVHFRSPAVDPGATCPPANHGRELSCHNKRRRNDWGHALHNQLQLRSHHDGLSTRLVVSDPVNADEAAWLPAAWYTLPIFDARSHSV